MADLPYSGLIDEINQTPESIDLYQNMTSKFKTWINNQTRLNATNMNELTSFIRGYSEEVGNKIEDFISLTLRNLVELNAGWKVQADTISSTGQRTPHKGELFNDYANNTAEGLFSSAEGTHTTASGENSHAQNEHTTASGKNSTAMGDESIASGENSLAGGAGSVAGGDNSTAFGQATTANYTNQFVIGKYNANSQNNIFEIGNGTSPTQTKNIFLVTTEGKTIGGVDNLDKDTDTPETLAPKGYVDEQIDRLDKNVWLGYIEVTQAQYDDSEQFTTLLNNAVLDFTKDTHPPDGRPRRNGDQITVEITDLPEGEPGTPEIWMFVDPDPKEGEEPQDPTPGTWQFFSSLQPLMEATINNYGLVKLGKNITLNDNGQLMMVWNDWT